jgi:hypothetical protein
MSSTTLYAQSSIIGSSVDQAFTESIDQMLNVIWMILPMVALPLFVLLAFKGVNAILYPADKPAKHTSPIEIEAAKRTALPVAKPTLAKDDAPASKPTGVNPVWEKYRKQLSFNERKLVTHIELLANKLNDEADLSLEDAHNKDTILNEYLPQAIKMFDKAITKRSDRKELDALLNTQLSSMKEGLEDIIGNVEDQLVRDMKVHALFLNGKYALAKQYTQIKSPTKKKFIPEG